MRAIWKGSIGFGLVVIPVRLYAATEKKDPRFHYVHAACGTPIRYKKWCPSCNREVESDEIAWGYEVEKGQYVLLNREEYEFMPDSQTRAIGISDFVDASEIDPVYFDKPYYLQPAEGAEKAYTLLRTVMERLGRVAVARFTVRTRESLAIIRAYRGNMLVLHTMLWPDEVRNPAELQPARGVQLDDREFEMAKALVDMMHQRFEPEAYRSGRRDYLLKLIQQKVAAREVETPRAEEGKVIDLIEALQQSMALASKARDGEDRSALGL